MLYEYQCKKCNTITEKITFDYEKKSIKCPVCGARAKKILSTGSFRKEDSWRK